MPDRSGLIRWAAGVGCVALFVADYGFNVMAKPVPPWAYIIPGLLAVGIEMNALRRLLLQAVRVMARIPPDENGEEG